MKLNIENFGKIKSAKIELNGYSIFIGDNNSGKTYLMQLIYGVVQTLCNISHFDTPVFSDFPYKVDDGNVQLFQDSINKWLNDNKHYIVKNTFNSEINISSLSIEIDLGKLKKDNVLLRKIKSSEIAGAKKRILYSQNVDKTGDVFICIENERFIYVLAKEQDRSDSFWRDFFVGILFERLLCGNDSGALYLPVSRGGFNLVYRDLMAAMVTPKEYNLGANLKPISESKKMGLTKPVFDYLIFMQTYKPDEGRLKKNRNVIDFINKKIIKGSITHFGDEIRYISENGVDLPLFLASSMVNELTPVVHLLSSVNPVGRVFYDEIETSQHPTTQIQLARLMNRLVNVGINLIVSTHSDTMASAISNLVALSFAKDKERKCVKLGLEKADLLQEDVVHAYQFLKENDGLSVVTEVGKFNELGMGYDFSLFSNASEEIFKAAKIIYEE